MRTQLRLLYHNTRQHLFKHIQTFQQQNYYNNDVKSTITYLTTSSLKNNNLKKKKKQHNKNLYKWYNLFYFSCKNENIGETKKKKKTMEDGTTI